jgi:hypothetical protein
MGMLAGGALKYPDYTSLQRMTAQILSMAVGHNAGALDKLVDAIRALLSYMH